MSKTIRIGTRGSALALWQAEETSRLIKNLPGAPPVEIVIIKTQGDLQQTVPLWATPGKGFFTAELDRAQLANDVDIVVHSLKDLATILTPGLVLTAVLEREDPRDALVSAKGGDLMALPRGARIGTSSLRRRAFLKHMRPDLEHVELRGNVPTRAFPSAVAQGAIGICTRDGDAETQAWIAPLNHRLTRIAADAERALLRRLEGGCQVPVGALATIEGGTVTLYSAACNLDGADFVAAEASAPVAEAAALGTKLAEDLLANGATRVLAKADERRQAAQH